MMGGRQWTEATGDGTEAAADSASLDPELGWGGGHPTACWGGSKWSNAKAWCGPSASKHPYTPKQNHPLQVRQAVVTRNWFATGLVPTTAPSLPSREKNHHHQKTPARLTIIHFQRPQSLLVHLIRGENCLKWGSMPVSFPPEPPAPQHLRTEWGQAQRMQTGWTRCPQVGAPAAAFILRIYLRKALLEGTLTGHKRHH